MKGIILAGGRGERLFPITRAISKQLLPVYDKPMVYYPLCTLMQCGVREVLVITRPGETDRFEALLADGAQWGIAISYAVQSAPNGIAEALIIGADYIADDRFALALGDNICGPGVEEMFAEAAGSDTDATIFVKRVDDPGRYGVVAFDDSGVATGIVEKPATPPSPFAVTGLYFYDDAALAYAQELTPSARGELEITDVNNACLAAGRLTVRRLPDDTAWLDMGTPEGLHEASALVAAEQAKQGSRIGTPEAVALRNGWIDTEQLARIAAVHGDNDYRRYLQTLGAGK